MLRKEAKTYCTRDSLVVTDPTTSLAITNLMCGNKGVLKRQLWSQETGASDHWNGSTSLRLLGSFFPFSDRRRYPRLAIKNLQCLCPYPAPLKVICGRVEQNRQVRRIIKFRGSGVETTSMARQLALHRHQAMSYAHLEQAIWVAKEFNNYVEKTQGHNDCEYAGAEGLRLE